MSEMTLGTGTSSGRGAGAGGAHARNTLHMTTHLHRPVTFVLLLSPTFVLLVSTLRCQGERLGQQAVSNTSRTTCRLSVATGVWSNSSQKGACTTNGIEHAQNTNSTCSSVAMSIRSTPPPPPPLPWFWPVISWGFDPGFYRWTGGSCRSNTTTIGLPRVAEMPAAIATSLSGLPVSSPDSSPAK